MKRWTVVEITVALFVVIALGVGVYFLLTFHSSSPHQWQPHEMIALAIFAGLYLAGSSIGSGMEKMAKAIDNHAGALREAYRAWEHEQRRVK